MKFTLENCLTEPNLRAGKYAITPIIYNEESHTLTIDQRKGQFSGMIKNRIFKVVVVKEGHGTDIDIVKEPDSKINYDGTKQVIELQGY